MTHEERLKRARVALEGLSVGDALGGHFELSTPERLMSAIQYQRLPGGVWRYTDDTNMALSIYQILREESQIDQDKLAKSFAYRYERGRGYGMGARHLCLEVQKGTPWRVVSTNLFGGTGSYGNGAAMRIPPLGAYFADDLDACVENARKSSEVTHAHPEGVAGGIAVAVATAVVQRNAGTLEAARAEYYDVILQHTPESEVHRKIKRARDIQSIDPAHAAGMLGNGSAISAQDTVPFVVWSAFTAMDDYETAIWRTASVGGDVDTTCAMVGGIVACMVGIENIPQRWREHTETLPQWSLGGT